MVSSPCHQVRSTENLACESLAERYAFWGQCGWTNSCTKWSVVYPDIHRASSIPTGAGICSSTVCQKFLENLYFLETAKFTVRLGLANSGCLEYAKRDDRKSHHPWFYLSTGTSGTPNIPKDSEGTLGERAYNQHDHLTYANTMQLISFGSP